VNQSALKTFAQETRRKLRDLIGGRLDYVLSADTAELRQQAAQVNELRAALKNEGRDLLIERVAYTWFNRLAALRFMDANGYHPFGARVITPATANETLPELLQQTRAGVLDADFKSQITNPKTFDDILAGRIPVENVEAHIYRLLLVAACNYYHQLMPFMFERIAESFAKHGPLSKVAIARKGMVTAANESFVRFWHEVDSKNIGFGFPSRETAKSSGRKWFSYAKGGPFRKWYGNLEAVVNWESDGLLIQTTKHPTDDRVRATNFNLDSIFRPAVCWTVVTISKTSFRIHGPGFLYDAAAGLCQPRPQKNISVILGMLNSRVAQNLLALINPTINLHPGYLEKLPFPEVNEAAPIVSACVELARADWDNFETSWDFHSLPVLRSGLKQTTLEASWQNWKVQCDDIIHRMMKLETENNQLFIAAYGLQDEIKPEVPEDEITLARADARRDMVAFISYAVGCMMGRYSLDQPGLILADAGATLQDYLAKIPKPTFAPDADGIIPVLDGEWFTDDIVGRFREFLRVTFGDATLAENLAFIEASLGKELPKYFTREFYKDHLKTYKKRPIYWMFRSPEGSFQALVYLHRYNRDTVSVLLNEYVREFIGKLEEKHRQQTIVTLNESARPGDRTKAAKEISKIDKILKEIRAWERDVLLPLAQQRLEIDLDDGVKVNYLKFKGAVVNIPGLDKGEDE